MVYISKCYLSKLNIKNLTLCNTIGFELLDFALNIYMDSITDIWVIYYNTCHSVTFRILSSEQVTHHTIHV